MVRGMDGGEFAIFMEHGQLLLDYVELVYFLPSYRLLKQSHGYQTFKTTMEAGENPVKVM